MTKMPTTVEHPHSPIRGRLSRNSLLRPARATPILATMKTLYLLRHAKSSWRDESLDDHDRPLAPRGTRAATKMGDFIKSHLPLPQKVLCSSSARTRATYELATSGWTEEVPVVYERNLYLAGPADIQKRLAKLPEAIGRVMVIGHNPALQQLAVKLIFEGDPESMNKLRTKFPTAALAEIELRGKTWRSLDPTGGRLVRFVVPKDLERT